MQKFIRVRDLIFMNNLALSIDFIQIYDKISSLENTVFILHLLNRKYLSQSLLF